jgi:hypothetical protein
VRRMIRDRRLSASWLREPGVSTRIDEHESKRAR